MHIQGDDRFQSIMFPEVIDDYVPEDAQVRYIDAFVDRLNLSALNFQRVTTKDTGRPPYHPADLLKLYLYGYLNRVRSSRRLEQETYRNVEVIWLIRKLHPDFKTIADFRKNNGQAIRDLCRLFTVMCRDEGLFGGEMLAIDGSKFKASNSKKRNFTESKIKRLIKESEKKIDEYLHELDKEDEKEANIHKPSKEELRKKIDRLDENLKKIFWNSETHERNETKSGFVDRSRKPRNVSRPSYSNQLQRTICR
jgi:transposase